MHMKFCPLVGLGVCLYVLLGASAKASVADCVVENGLLSVSVDAAAGSLGVVDKRTGRKWSCASRQSDNPFGWPSLSVRRENGNTLWLRSGGDGEGGESVRIFLEGAEVAITIDLAREREIKKFTYPAPFATQKGDSLIIPYNEGMRYPVDEAHEKLGSAPFFAGFRMSMHFFGVVDDATGAGMMAIVESPDDAMMDVFQTGPEKLWVACPTWLGEFGKFGYKRRIRYVFLDGGGHVAMAKRFRSYAKANGWLRTFMEKAIQRPNVLKLPGMPNFWPFIPDKDKVAHARELKSLGIDSFLWSSGGMPGTVRQISAMDDVLIGCYDNMQDVLSPAIAARNGKSLKNSAWPHDVMWTGDTPDTWRKGWGVEMKDGTNTVMEHCAVMCDVKAPSYLYEKVRTELETKPYTSRFMDTTFSEPWKECANPAHRQTRRESHFWRRELLRMLAERFGLVTGSERGSCSGVPVVDYFEGMMSISLCGVPRDGRDILIPWTNNLPKVVTRYQVGAKYRLPLWELVFHDCCCAHWYWGDTQNKMPAVWGDRTLFNILYGTSPMFLYNEKQWPLIRDRVAKTCKIVAPIARSVGFCEMTGHVILTPDRTVQRTSFANGVEITVNFSDSDWKDESGKTVRAKSYSVKNVNQTKRRK